MDFFWNFYKGPIRMIPKPYREYVSPHQNWSPCRVQQSNHAYSFATPSEPGWDRWHVSGSVHVLGSSPWCRTRCTRNGHRPGRWCFEWTHASTWSNTDVSSFQCTRSSPSVHCTACWSPLPWLSKLKNSKKVDILIRIYIYLLYINEKYGRGFLW